MRKVLQSDFSAARGNALQACFASIFELELSQVANFIESGSDYLRAVDAWLAPRGLAFLKIAVNAELEFPSGPGVCVLAGPSPRGDFKHAVVGRVAGSAREAVIGTGFELLHDPHPDARGLAGPPVWAGFFVRRAES